MNTTPDAPTTSDLAAEMHHSLYGDLLTLDQAAFALGLSRFTLTKKVAAGQVETLKIGRRVYVTRAAMAAYIATIRHKATSNGAVNPTPESAPDES